MVAANQHGLPIVGEVGNTLHDSAALRATVDEITHEYESPIGDLTKQQFELREVAVHIADDRCRFPHQVSPQSSVSSYAGNTSPS
jgi:hypothetical protein